MLRSDLEEVADYRRLLVRLLSRDDQAQAGGDGEDNPKEYLAESDRQEIEAALAKWEGRRREIA